MLFVYVLLTLCLLVGLKFQKVIPFKEITAVRRAKAVAVFPTAIEIIAGGKKVSVYFCTALVFKKTMIFVYNFGFVICASFPAVLLYIFFIP